MSRVIFTRANLLDGTTPSRPDSTVVVEGDHIAEVSSEPAIAGPEDRVIDLAGQTLMPGMYSGHLHVEFGFQEPHHYMNTYAGTERPQGVLMAMAMNNVKALVASGVTGYIGAGCSNDLDAQLKMVIAEGLIDGPRILASSRHINTTGHDNDTAKWWYQMVHPYDVFADGPDEIRKAVREEIRRGAEMIKIFPTSGHGAAGRGRGLTHDELLAAVEAAHDRGKMIRGHCCWRDSIIECVEAGVDIIDHGDEVDERCIELMAERGTAWVPSMMFLKFMRDLPAGALDLPAEHVQRDWENLCRMLPIANDAGVRILPGDDYGLPMLPHTPGIYAKELSLYADEVGVKPLDVLRWATAHAGALAGDGSGTVVEGAPADLLVVESDPSSDITVLENPETSLRAIMLGGRFVKDELAGPAPSIARP